MEILFLRISDDFGCSLTTFTRKNHLVSRVILSTRLACVLLHRKTYKKLWSQVCKHTIPKKIRQLFPMVRQHPLGKTLREFAILEYLMQRMEIIKKIKSESSLPSRT
jgi:hypothetical protein